MWPTGRKGTKSGVSGIPPKSADVIGINMPNLSQYVPKPIKRKVHRWPPNNLKNGTSKTITKEKTVYPFKSFSNTDKH